MFEFLYHLVSPCMLDIQSIAQVNENKFWADRVIIIIYSKP